MSTLTGFLFAAPESRTTPALIARWERMRLGITVPQEPAQVGIECAAIVGIVFPPAFRHIRDAAHRMNLPSYNGALQ
jgi:hypothetical protein